MTDMGISVLMSNTGRLLSYLAEMDLLKFVPNQIRAASGEVNGDVVYYLMRSAVKLDAALREAHAVIVTASTSTDFMIGFHYVIVFIMNKKLIK